MRLRGWCVCVCVFLYVCEIKQVFVFWVTGASGLSLQLPVNMANGRTSLMLPVTGVTGVNDVSAHNASVQSPALRGLTKLARASSRKSLCP